MPGILKPATGRRRLVAIRPTLAERGFRLPAEWEEQESIWMVWPRDQTTWPGEHLEWARQAYGEAVAAIAASGQPVDLIVHPELELPLVASKPGVRVHRVEHVDSWIRDYGPLTLVGPQGRRALRFQFDAWGGKYDSLRADDVVSDSLDWPCPIERVPFVLEGGGVETDGEGTVLVTEACLLVGRGHAKQTAEAALRDHLGATRVIWLGDGIQGDDTDGHIDTITRFTGPGRVVTSVAPAGHRDHGALAHNRALLVAAGLDVVDLPVPDVDLLTDDGDILPAGHANFLVTNHLVLVPTFGGHSDEEAVRILAAEFPTRRVVAIDHRDLIWGFGGIHCLSMQVAAPSSGPQQLRRILRG